MGLKESEASGEITGLGKKIRYADIEKLNDAVNKRNAEIGKLEKRINEIMDRIYKNFSKSVGVASIREYEENQLKTAQNLTEERLSLSSQHSKLKYQLEYEQNRDMSSRISELESSLSALEHDLKTRLLTH